MSSLRGPKQQEVVESFDHYPYMHNVFKRMRDWEAKFAEYVAKERESEVEKSMMRLALVNLHYFGR